MVTESTVADRTVPAEVAEITHLADTRPEIPIGVAFVNARGQPSRIGRDGSLRIHRPSIRGFLPVAQGVE